MPSVYTYVRACDCATDCVCGLLWVGLSSWYVDTHSIRQSSVIGHTGGSLIHRYPDRVSGRRVCCLCPMCNPTLSGVIPKDSPPPPSSFLSTCQSYKLRLAPLVASLTSYMLTISCQNYICRVFFCSLQRNDFIVAKNLKHTGMKK